MVSTWGLASFLWGSLIIGVGSLLVYEQRKSPEQKKHDAEEACARGEKNRLAETVVEVQLLNGVTVQRKRGGMGGALMGLFFGGVAGAAVGAVLPGMKTVELRSFLVKYGDGREKVVQCAQDSLDYKLWMKHVKNK